MDVGRGRFGHVIPAFRWLFLVAQDRQHVIKRGKTGLPDGFLPLHTDLGLSTRRSACSGPFTATHYVISVDFHSKLAG